MSFDEFVGQTTPIKKTETVKEAPKSKFKIATEGLGRTLGAILGAINIPETFVGGIKEGMMAEQPPQTIEQYYKEKYNREPTLEERLSNASGFSGYVPYTGSKTKPFVYAGKKILTSLKGDLSETGTQKSFIKEAEYKKGKPLSTGENVAATAKSILTDILVSPLTYITLGGSSPIKIGKEGAQAGLTKAGTKAYANLIKEGVSKGLTRDAAVNFAKSSMEEVLKSSSDDVIRKLFSQGGIRFAEWIPEVGGESIVPYSKISKFVEPIS